MAKKKTRAPRPATRPKTPKQDIGLDALRLAARVNNEVDTLRATIAELATKIGDAKLPDIIKDIDALYRRVKKVEEATPAKVVVDEVVSAVIRGAAAVLSCDPDFQNRLPDLLIGAIQGDVVGKIERDCRNRVGPMIQARADATIEKIVWGALTNFNVAAYLDAHMDRVFSATIEKLDQNGRRINDAITEKSASAVQGYVEKRKEEAK